MFKLFKYIRGKDLVLVFVSLFLTVAQAVADISQPFLISEVLDFADQPNPDYFQHILIAFGMIGLGLASFLFGSLAIYISAGVSVRLSGIIRHALFTKIQNLSMVEIDKFTPASLITRITNDVIFFENTTLLFLRLMVRSSFLLFGGLIASFIYAAQLRGLDGNSLWWLAFVILGALTLLIIIIFTIIYFAIPLYRKQRYELDGTNRIVRENLLGIKIIKAYNLENKQASLFAKQNLRYKLISQKQQTISYTIIPIINFFTSISVLLLLMVGAEVIANASIGIVPAFIQMVTLVGLGIILSIVVLINYGIAKAGANRINEVLAVQKSIENVVGGNDINLPSVGFHNVVFKYKANENNPNILKNINFTVQPYQTVGIIGPTGSGKTTLATLLTRLYDPQEGSITIGDYDLKTINYSSLRDAIGVVTQKSVLFSGTIRSNLAFGKPNATEADYELALKQAQAYDFVMQRPDQIDSIVSQRGSNFSGGQQQRLAIARALIKKPKILILDNCTSALDPITEKKVLDTIKELGTSTVFLISERINTMQFADQILVLDKGEITAIGNHVELMTSCALYQQIAKSQNVSLDDQPTPQLV